MKKHFLLTLSFALCATAFICKEESCGTRKVPHASTVQKMNRRELLRVPKGLRTCALGKKIKSLTISHLDIPGDSTKYGATTLSGKIARVIQYRTITDVVEKKYHLPHNILLGMITKESTGIPMLGNSSCDGGFGLIHMQPCVARMFGLRTYKSCDSLICHVHHEELLVLIKKTHGSIKKMQRYDERFNPLLNIDAAGRMIAYYMSLAPKGEDSVRYALARFSGPRNREVYYKDVHEYMKQFSDSSLIAHVAKEFNRSNTRLHVNGHKADFARFVALHDTLCNQMIAYYK